MKLMRKAGSLAVVTLATVAMTVLPAVSAQARTLPDCPQVAGVCTWTQAAYEGEGQIIFSEEQVIQPAVRSVSNPSRQTWCFYERPLFDDQGRKREIRSGRAVSDLGFNATSAKPGSCWQEN
ncbi:peptidase inhibitor family I36 protein [Streptomyces pinistramenti]|uniref:peptidase inhibitor family I36 protein n=1 Tax=Streptomyces pinistramenti TaxID=2884812 RepID=UPI001D071A53|nr:peptidase inhibitor family I36 protein [Streptomyces pinistramenti]MCB5911988.1 peptidase inhibitor family I36 protein [Streptomyces pinistramenti]